MAVEMSSTVPDPLTCRSSPMVLLEFMPRLQYSRSKGPGPESAQTGRSACEANYRS